MTLQQLQYLVALSESDSISQAAQNCFVTQSNISKAIKQLEQELGFALIERNYRGVSFTLRGQEFLRDAYAVLDQYKLLQERYLREDREALRFSVSSQHYIFVLEAISRTVALLKNHPYAIHLREYKTSQIIQDVVSRKSRLGFIYYYNINENFIRRELERASLEFRPFCGAAPHAYLVRSHPLAQNASITLADLEGYPYVCYDMDTDPLNFSEEIYSPPHPRQVIRVSDRSSMFSIVRHTDSYTLGSGFLLDNYTAEDIVTRPLCISSGSIMHIGWIKPIGQDLTPECEQFLQFCREALERCYSGPRPEEPPSPDGD